MPQPPLLPEETLARVHRLAWRNGLSIVIVATLAALLQAASKDPAAAFAGVLAAGAGALELHGATLLGRGDRRGVNWLIRSELILLVVILAYCGMRLLQPNFAELGAAFCASFEFPGMREKWAELEGLGITERQYLTIINSLTYSILAVASLIYQGGMALYYSRRQRALDAALADRSDPGEPET